MSGSVQLRRFRCAIRDGIDLESAAAASNMSIGEARLWVAADAENPPGPECYEMIGRSSLKKDESIRVLIGDVREQLLKMPSQSVDCVVTSPPYWGLRDYGVEGQIGLEPTLGEHIAVMVDVFREVRRVLKAHGTLWLNYGDCYAAAPNGKSAAAYKADGTDDRAFRDKPFSTVGPINARTYCNAESGSRGVNREFHDAMRPKAGPIHPAAGSEINRGKRESNRTGHEGRWGGGNNPATGFLKPKDLCMIPNRLAIALQDDGWYIRSEIIWHKPNPMPESVYDRPTSAHEKIWLCSKGEDYFYNHEAIREPLTGGTHPRRAGPNSRVNVDRVPVSKKTGTGVGWGHQDRVNAAEGDRGRGRVVGKTAPAGTGIKNNSSFNASMLDAAPQTTKNARNVWTIAPRPFRDAHFATFPPALAERCIKAGVPQSVCGYCGAVEGCGGICQTFDRKPGVVLDPFGGAGTVGLVAKQLGLHAILIELNPEYAALSERRIAADPGPSPIDAEAA
jgi:DNA modification methylase